MMSRRNRKQKNTPISQLSREELEARFMQIDAHNTQLQNLLAKCQGLTGGIKKTRKERPFDFSKHSRRHVLLKLAYLGWDYNGFAVQEDSPQTIETQLFSAFLKTRLIESRETSNYHRCGRTDKGVSAFDQVISITLRSNLKSGVGIVKDETRESAVSEDGDDSGDAEEIEYVSLMNKVLPPEIRMLAWCPVEEGYSARFDCSFRTYKYFFPRGKLDIKLMNEAAQHLVGCYDYRNFCKMDVGNGVVNYHRRIVAVNICDFKDDFRNHGAKCIKTENRSANFLKGKESYSVENNRFEKESTKSMDIDESEEQYLDGYDMCIATIEGQAFLWHQIRAIMSVLFLIGERKEEPSIIQELLNVEKNPRKPQYCLASDIPLNLYETTFFGVVWQWDDEVVRSVISQLQALWTQHSVRTTMIRRMLCDLETRYRGEDEHHSRENKALSTSVNSPGGGENILTMIPKTIPQDQSESLVPGARTKVYHPLLLRPTCESLESRVKHYVKRKRLDPDILQKINSSDTPPETMSDADSVCNSAT